MALLGSFARDTVRVALVTLMVFSSVALSCGQPSRDDAVLQDFFQALLREDTQTARQILSTHTNLARVNASRYFGKLPLLVAASKGQLEIVDQLLKLGADINAEGDTWDTANHKYTALEISIYYNQPAVCRRLLEANPDLNHRSSFAGGALHLACSYGRDEMAGWLLDHGANPLLPRSYSFPRDTPLALNIAKGGGRLVPRMLQVAGTNAVGYLRANGPVLLRVAATSGEVVAVEALLQAGVSPAATNPNEPVLLQEVALAAAANPGAFSDVRRALQGHGAEYDIFAVTGFGDLETARTRISTNQNLITARDSNGDTPLHWAVQANQLTLTSFWLGAGASPNATNLVGQTPVHLAATAGLVKHLDLLLATKPALDLRDAKGQTPLDAAMKAERTETIRMLMANQRGAIPKDRGLSTGLHEAAKNGNIIALDALVGSTSVDARNELGFTPFHLAIQKGQLGAAALLLDRGANVNAADPGGNTALHQIAGTWTFSITGRPSTGWLARRNQDPRQATYLRFLTAGGNDDGWPRQTLQAVGFLLACGADAALTNRAGQTPIQLLMDSKTVMFEAERGEVLKLLGAESNIDQRDAAGNTALHRAMQAVGADEVDTLLALIAGGANVNATNAAGKTPLHLAVSKMYSWPTDERFDHPTNPLLALLRAKANVNAQDYAGRTPLHVLVSADTSFKEQATRALIAAGADPNLRDMQGCPPVLAALTAEWPWHDADECVSLLVAAGADLKVSDQQGRTILHYLALMGNGGHDPTFFAPELMAALAKAQLDLNARDNAGDTPLHIAAQQGAAPVFEWLSGEGAKLDATNAAGETPRLLALRNTNRFVRFRFPASEDLHAAARRDDVETIRRLLQAEPQLISLTNDTGETPLRLAAKNYKTNAVNLLITSGAPWDVVSAAILGRTDVLQSIIAGNPKAANTSAYGKPVLHWAAESGSVSAVETLLGAGAKRDASDRTGLSALGAAIRSNRTDVVSLLRASGSKDNVFDFVILGKPEAAQALVKSEPKLGEATNAMGFTPVQTAVAFGQTRVLAALLEQLPPDPASAGTRSTALHIAATGNRTNEAALLIQYRADVASVDYVGAQPLHHAASGGHAELVALLLEHGAKPDVLIETSNNGNPLMLAAGTTALHLAVLGGHTNVIAVLLRAGANVNYTNAMGLTPMDLAQGGDQFGLQYSRPGMPSAILAGPGFRALPPILPPHAREAVLAQLEQAGAKASNRAASPAERF